MKLKNITSSDKELLNISTGKKIVVESNKTIELEKAYYNKNAFSVVMPEIKVSEDINIEQIEEINNEKEVN